MGEEGQKAFGLIACDSTAEEARSTQPTQPIQPPKRVPKRASEELIEALRAEFRGIIEGDDFPTNLITIAQLAQSARRTIMTLNVPAGLGLHRRGRQIGPGGMSLNDGGELDSMLEADDSLSQYPNPPNPINTWGSFTGVHHRRDPEQFGARAIREIVSLVPAVAETWAKAMRPPPTTASLVDAISIARAKGLEDLAARIESKLLEGLDAPAAPSHATTTPAAGAGGATNGASHVAGHPHANGAGA